MADPLGTVKQEFGKYWVYVNPNVLKGPNTWDVANIPFAPDGCVDSVSAVLPIKVEQNYADVVLKFSIVELSNIPTQTSLLASALTELSSSNPKPHPRTVCLSDVSGTLPVKSVNERDKVALYFSIKELPTMSDYPDWDTDGGLPYNETRNLNGITGEEPLVSELVGDTVNVSFNINSLPDI